MKRLLLAPIFAVLAGRYKSPSTWKVRIAPALSADRCTVAIPVKVKWDGALVHISSAGPESTFLDRTVTISVRNRAKRALEVWCGHKDLKQRSTENGTCVSESLGMGQHATLFRGPLRGFIDSWTDVELDPADGRRVLCSILIDCESEVSDSDLKVIGVTVRELDD